MNEDEKMKKKNSTQRRITQMKSMWFTFSSYSLSDRCVKHSQSASSRPTNRVTLKLIKIKIIEIKMQRRCCIKYQRKNCVCLWVTYVSVLSVSVFVFCFAVCDYANVIIISCEIHLDFVQKEWHGNGLCVVNRSFRHRRHTHTYTINTKSYRKKSQMCHKHIYASVIVKRLLFSAI